ncbi:hypothetical protein JZ751_022446 [Albula glossodonta]|uniref:Uncharacterized protein n=1 Tax=Albula glossodonta TaxID=121402 RepID=A0A8T2NKJ4_9TELE|nr:hypothetical protein JZ751_022446 [Albula glossodonta]
MNRTESLPSTGVCRASLKVTLLRDKRRYNQTRPPLHCPTPYLDPAARVGQLNYHTGVFFGPIFLDKIEMATQDSSESC